MELKITDLLDEFMEEDILLDHTPVPDNLRIKEAAMKRIKKNQNIRPLRVALIAAAIIVLLTGTVLGVYYTRITSRMENEWNERAETEMTAQQKDYVEALSADIGESITDGGITITLDSVTCTADKAYVLLHYELDPELYDVEALQNCISRNMTTVSNDEFGTLLMSQAGADGETRDDGVWTTYSVEFLDLPDECVLNDGNSTISMEIASVELWYDNDEVSEIEGSWNFEFTLPEGAGDAPVTAEAEITFAGGISLLITDVEVTESGCKFAVETDSDEYYFVDSEMADLVRAAEPGLAQFTVDAELENGTTVPCTGAHMDFNEETMLDEWTISWSAPLDPSTVKCLIFSDGTESAAIQMK